MSQYNTGSVQVTNGSATVTGTGTSWTSYAAAGDVFTIVGSRVPYIVGSVDSNTQITLTANYAGDSGSALPYAISTSRTPNYGIPYPEMGDTDVATVLKEGMLRVDQLLLSTQQSKSANYTTVLSDANKHIYHPTTDNNARAFTIDSNTNVPYAIGTRIEFINEINTVSINVASDTLVLLGAGSPTTGSRALAANGIATALKVAATRWVIWGTGLT